MDDVLNKIESKTAFDDYSYAISFDDGFYNNYSIAVPVLKKLNLSAIFYITTDFIDKNLTSWIDQIEYISEKFIIFDDINYIKDWINENVILLDLGINSLNGKLVGDIDIESVKDIAQSITPVPGGIGPITTALLLKNCC